LENNNKITDEIEEDFEEKLDNNLNSRIDDLEKRNIDLKRIKKIDQTKKKAAVESVIDERTSFLLNKLIERGILNRIEGIVSAGKEANVYLAYDNNNSEVAVKIYKIDSNTSKWMRKYIIGDPRYKKIPHNSSKIIFLWASKEFKNLQRAYKAGLNVPRPIYTKNNFLIMEYIGFGTISAPLLKDIKHPHDPAGLLEDLLDFIKRLYQDAKLVHGDLSEFNVLYHNHKPIVIDISQAVSIHHPKAEFYLVRDIKNVFKYFENKDIILPDPREFYYEVINYDQ
jgi:RIO kinase 1